MGNYTNEIVVLVFQVVITLIGLFFAIFAPKCIFSVPRHFFVGHQLFFMIYVLTFLNPFMFQFLTTSEFIMNTVTFEFFSTGFINGIYVMFIHRSLCSIGLHILGLSSFLVVALVLFIAMNICEWVGEELLEQNICKFYSYELLHVILIVLASLVHSYTMWKIEKHAIKSFIFHVILTLLVYLGFSQGLKIASVFAIHQVNVKFLLHLVPTLNVAWIVLFNCQHPKERREMRIFGAKLMRGGRTGPVPRISVEESGHVQSHIALNLMRNPLNSFTKLQRRYEEILVKSMASGESSSDGQSSSASQNNNNIINCSSQNNGFLEIPKETNPSLEAPPQPTLSPRSQNPRIPKMLQRASLANITFRKNSKIERRDSMDDCGCSPPSMRDLEYEDEGTSDTYREPLELNPIELMRFHSELALSGFKNQESSSAPAHKEEKNLLKNTTNQSEEAMTFNPLELLREFDTDIKRPSESPEHSKTLENSNNIPILPNQIFKHVIVETLQPKHEKLSCHIARVLSKELSQTKF